MNYQVAKEYNTKIRFDVFLIRNTVNDIWYTVKKYLFQNYMVPYYPNDQEILKIISE